MPKSKTSPSLPEGSRLLLVGLVAALALLAASCGNSAEPEPEPEPTVSEATEQAEPTVEPKPEPEQPEPAEETPEATEDASPTGESAEQQQARGIDIVLADTPGPYAVGVQTVTVADQSGGPRDLTVDVWFPLDPANTDGLAPQQYTFLPGTYYESPHALAATSAALATDQSFPLVIYSHGSGGLRYIHSNYTEALASYGYIVAAPDHTGNTAIDQISGTETDLAETAINRPTDVSAVIDAFLDPSNEETGPFAAIINADQVAVTGHSFGGFTSYAVVGGYSGPSGTYEPDSRVDAIITLAPATSEALLTDDQLGTINVPALVMTGTDDKSTPIEPNTTRPWELSSSSPSYRVDLVAAEHQTFTDVCDYQDFLSELENPLQIVVDLVNDFAEQGCAPGDMPAERAQAITNTFAVTFLDSVFRDGQAISQDQVDEQDDLIYLVKE